GEPGGEHDLEAVVLQRPDGVLAGGTGTEVRAGHQHRTAGVGLLVQHEGRVAAPGGEQRVLEPGAGDPLEVDRRDDLVGVDVAAAQRDPDTGVGGELLHDVLLVVVGAQTCIGTLGSSGASGEPSKEVRSTSSGRSRSATADRVPRTAVAAAT